MTRGGTLVVVKKGFQNAMNLDEGQRKKVGGWIAEGLKLSDIQNRLNSEFGLKLSYLEVRLLVDDLKLTPKDPEPTKPAPETALTAPPPPQAARTPPAPGASRVSVTVDQIAIPGAVVSGKVTFSDQKQVAWAIDQRGQIALLEKGYTPPAGDIPQFQAALDAELSRMGLA